MVVLDQYKRLLCTFDFLQHGLRKFLIHALVVFPVSSAKHGARMGHMAKRPDSLVCEPQIISLLLFLCEPEAAECVMRMIRGNTQPVIGVDGFAISVRGPMCDPRPVTGAQNRLQSRNQAARWYAYLDSIAAMYVFVRLAV